jgi:hypothetical protein
MPDIKDVAWHNRTECLDVWPSESAMITSARILPSTESPRAPASERTPLPCAKPATERAQFYM